MPLRSSVAISSGAQRLTASMRGSLEGLAYTRLMRARCSTPNGINARITAPAPARHETSPVLNA